MSKKPTKAEVVKHLDAIADCREQLISFLSVNMNDAFDNKQVEKYGVWGKVNYAIYKTLEDLEKDMREELMK